MTARDAQRVVLIAIPSANPVMTKILGYAMQRLIQEPSPRFEE